MAKTQKGTKKAPKQQPEAEQAKGPDVAGLGTDLEETLKQAKPEWRPKSVDGIKSTVASLKAGKVPTNKQLVTLRDTINETAAAARAEEATAVAKALSQLNRLVRRLERSTR